MHEYFVSETILEIVECEAAGNQDARVAEITVAIGELSSFVAESIEFYFSEISRGTRCEDARMNFHKIEALAVCGNCRAGFRPRQAFFICPECGSPVCELKRGNELYVDSIQLD